MRRAKEIFGKVLRILAIVLFASIFLGECTTFVYNRATNTEGDGYDPQTSLLGYALGIRADAYCNLQPGMGWDCDLPDIDYPNVKCNTIPHGILENGQQCSYGRIQESKDKMTFRYWLEVLLKWGIPLEIALCFLICFCLFWIGDSLTKRQNEIETIISPKKDPPEGYDFQI